MNITRPFFSSSARLHPARLLGALVVSALVFSAQPALAEASSPEDPQTASADAKTKSSAKSRKVQLKGQLNINTAGLEDLVLLPGIGPSTAAKIITFRKDSPFESLDHLVKVRGIGRKTLERIRSYLTLTGPSDLERVKAS